MNPESRQSRRHNAPQNQPGVEIDKLPHDDNLKPEVDLSAAETTEPKTENNDDFEENQSVAADAAKNERLGDLDEGLRLLEIERQSASLDLENWKSQPQTNSADFQYRLPHMKNRLKSAEQAISGAVIDKELVLADAETPEAVDEVVRTFIKKQLLEGKVKSQREGLKAIDNEEDALSKRLADHESTITLYQDMLNGNSVFGELGDDESAQAYKKDWAAKIYKLSDKYEATLTDKMSRDFSGRRAVLEEEIRAVQELGVDDAELPKSVAEDPDFEACLSEVNFNHSEDDEAYKRRTGHNPMKEAQSLFSKRFPHKAEFYKRLELTVVKSSPLDNIQKLKEGRPDVDSGSKQNVEKLIKLASAEEIIKTTETELRPEVLNEESLNDTEKLSQIFREAGMESSVIKIEGGDEFSEVIIFDRKEISSEKMIRLYRGVSHLDSSLLDQAPYAMRTENETGKPTIHEDVRQVVSLLADEPTYKNLSAYYEIAKSKWSPEELRRHEEDFKKIEDGILSGHSTRTELIAKQIEHGGGWGDSGITPYVSASTSPFEAASYGRKGFIVLDVPFSKIEYANAKSTEINIKGALDRNYITAILPRGAKEPKGKEEIDNEIERAIKIVTETTSQNLFEAEGFRAERHRKISEVRELDNVQWQKDVEIIRQKRVDELGRLFPEVIVDGALDTNEEEIDVYTKAKNVIFDYYDARYKQLGTYWGELSEKEYKKSGWGESKKFDRRNIDLAMLLKLREVVPLYEIKAKREKEKQEKRVTKTNSLKEIIKPPEPQSVDLPKPLGQGELIDLSEQANHSENYTELLFSRLKHPVIRKQLLDLFEANELWLEENPDITSAIKRDKSTGEPIFNDDGFPVFEWVTSEKKHTAKTREQIDLEISEAISRESDVTNIDLDRNFNESHARPIDFGGDQYNLTNRKAVMGVKNEKGPLSPKEIKNRSLAEAHEKGHVIRYFNESGYLKDKFSRAFDVSKLNPTTYLGDVSVRPDEFTDEEVIQSAKEYLFDFGNPVEVIERMSQLKNYFGMKGDEVFTKEHLDYARQHYFEDGMIDNNMRSFLECITPETEAAFLELINSVGV